MKIKGYLKFINEAAQEEEEELKRTMDQYVDLKEEIKSKIIDSLNSDDREVIMDFTRAYIRDEESNQIEGLINDSDIYDFYLGNRNQIDSLLADINFYDEAPSEMSSFSLYDYIIKGTKRAIKEIITTISEE